ncbi:hypothetical protein PACTADRAFT_76375 [Pachysolen tannophilus NRRL Y-2460]|uniref:Uncharacterized protein n=1 Tax=Pachysolen tannophilus NRRL Y-2460 TaxID=669874 RepID=A0A1E4TSN6_PACTA|nr:hypothetical protein PACTADRAFT_76375 [Pachysolen tannophilus NRRL Y-2460]
MSRLVCSALLCYLIGLLWASGDLRGSQGISGGSEGSSGRGDGTMRWALVQWPLLKGSCLKGSRGKKEEIGREQRGDP